MKKLSIKINDVIVIISTLLTFLMFCNANIYKMLSEVHCVVLFLIYLVLTILNVKQLEKREIFMVAVIVTILFVGLFFNSTGLGTILEMIGLVLSFVLIPKIEITHFGRKILKIVICVSYVYFFIADKSHLNTNFVGYIFLCFFMLLDNIFDFGKNLFSKIIYIFLLCVTVYEAHLFDCRTAQIMTVFYGIAWIIPMRFWNAKIVKKSIPYIITIGSIVIAYIYVFIFQNNITVDLSSISNKKFFSGRNFIWQEAFELIKMHPIFGVGSNYVLTSHFAYALHNTSMTIVTTFGVPVFIFYVIIYKNYMAELYKKINKNNKRVLIGIITLGLLDFFEAYLFWSVFGIVCFMIVVMGLNSYNEEKK